MNEKDSSYGIHGGVQSVNKIVVPNQAKKIFSQSFPKKSEKKSRSGTSTLASVIIKLPVNNIQKNISPKLKVNTTIALGDLGETKNLITKDTTNWQQKNKMISSSIYEPNNTKTNSDSSLK